MSSSVCKCTTTTTIPGVVLPSPPPLHTTTSSTYGCGCPCAQVCVIYPAGTFTGCVSSEGRRHCRRGVMWYNNGNVYCGSWVEGSPNTTTSTSTSISNPTSKNATTTPDGGCSDGIVSVGTKWFRGGDVYVGEWGSNVGAVGRNGYGVYTYASSEIVPLSSSPNDDEEVNEIDTSSSPSSSSSAPIGIVVKAQYRGLYTNDEPNDVDGVLVTFEPTPVLFSELPNFTSSAATTVASASFVGVRSVYRGGFGGGRKEGAGTVTMYDSKTGKVFSSVVNGVWYQGKRVSTTPTPAAPSLSSSTTTSHRQCGHQSVDGTTTPTTPNGEGVVDAVSMTAPFMGDDPFGAVTAALEGMDARMGALEARLTSKTNTSPQ